MLVILFEYLGMSSVWIFRHILPVGDDDEEPVAEVAPSEIRAALRGELQTLPTFEGAVIASSSIDEEPSSTARGNTVPASPFKTIATADLTSPATHPAAASSAASNVNAINVDESIAARAGVALASVGSRGIVAIASTAKDLIWMSSAFVGERIASVLNLAPSNSALPAQIPMSALGASAQSEAAQTSSSANTVRVQVMQAIDAVETRNAQSLFSSARWLTGCTRDCISGVVMLTVIDLAAAGFGFFGLVYAGSGIFAVVNSASLAVTAVLSRFLLKRPLSRPKVIAVAVVSGGLAFAGLGALLAPEQGSTAPMLLTATQTVRLEEHSFFSGTTRIVFGIVFTLFSTVLYSLEYVFAEQILLAAKRDKSITATQLCGYMGFTGTALFSTYVLFYTIPHWNHLVTQEMIRHRTSVIFQLFLFCCCCCSTHY
jgi:drug/metabolite transporter (DMT)-like permease